MEPITALSRSAVTELKKEELQDAFDVWALSNNAAGLNIGQLGNLSASREAGYSNEKSFQEAHRYILDILTHEKFTQLGEHVLGSDLTEYVNLVLPYLKAFALEMTAENALKACKEDPFQACYFPGGWREKNGQFVVVKVQLVEGTTAHISILNRGRGAERHERVAGFSFLHELSSPSYRIDLASDLAKKLFAEWKSLTYCTGDSRYKMELSSLDFYGRLAIYGEPVQEGERASRRISKEQYYSASFASSITTMFADIFHTQKISIEEFRRFSLVLKLFSLLQEFSHYSDSKKNRAIFTEAIDKTAVRATKLGPSLCNTLRIHAYCSDMKRRVGDAHDASVQEAASECSFIGKILQKPKRSVLEGSRHYIGGRTELSATYFAFKTPDSAQELIDELIRFNKTPSFHTLKVYISVRGFFREVYDKGFLYKITSDQAQKLLDALFDTVDAIPSASGRQRRQIAAEISLLALDMAAVCAERIESLKFEDRYTLCLPLLTGHDAAFQDPDAVRNLELVKQRFKKRAEGKKALFAAKINLQYGDEVNYLVNHIITKRVIDEFLKNHENKETLFSVVSRYYIQCENFKEPSFPQEEFTKPLNTIFGLLNRFVQTAGIHSLGKRRSYSNDGVLNVLENVPASKYRLLESEFFQKREARSNELVDDRQNLYYSIKVEGDDLATKKVGVIYQAYRQHAHDEELTDQLHRELCTLEAGRELRTLNSLDWLVRPNQFEAVYKRVVRDRLETLLFGPEGISYALYVSPHRVIEALCMFQQQYQQNLQDGELIEWCTSVVVRFCYHLVRAGVDKKYLQVLDTEPYLRKCQMDDKGAYRRSLALCHIARSEYNVFEFVKDLARAASYGVSLVEPTWPLLLGFSLSDPLFSARSDVLSTNEELLTELANELLGSSATYKWSIDSKSPNLIVGRSDSETFTLDLYTGESSISKGRIIDLLPYLKKQNTLLHLAAGKESFPASVDEYNLAKSVDGKLKATLTNRDTALYISDLSIRISVHLKKTVSIWATLHHGYLEAHNSGYRELSECTEYVLKEFLGHDDVECWKFQQASFLLIDRKNPKRAVCQNCQIYEYMELVDGVWTAQNRQLSFNSTTGDSALDALIERCFPKLKIGQSTVRGAAFFYEKDTCRKICCPSLNFSFTRLEDLGIWVYDGDPDFKLMTQTTVQELDGYSKAIVLKHVRDERRKVLLTPFSFDLDAKLPAAGPFVFDITADGMSSDASGHLYLALIFRYQRNFTEAMNHLDKSRHMGTDGALELAITNQIEKTPILTAPAIAFDVHMLSRAIEHCKRFTQKSYRFDQEHRAIEDLLHQKVRDYQAALSRFREGVSGIPDRLVVPSWMLEHPREYVQFDARLASLEQCLHRIRLDYAFDEKAGWFVMLSKHVQTKANTSRRITSTDAVRNLSQEDLVDDFLELVRYAVSDEKIKNAHVQSYILTYICQHNLSCSFIDKLLLQLLILMLNDPGRFKDFPGMRKVSSCVLEAGKRVKEKEEKYTLFPKRALSKIAQDPPCAKPPLLAKAPYLPWCVPQVSNEAFPQWPAKDLYERCFVEEFIFPFDEKTFWPVASWTSEDKIEMRLIDSLNEAFKSLKTKKRSVHVSKGDIDLDLREREGRIQTRIQALESTISNLLNTAHEASLSEFLALISAEQLPKLTTRDALSALLYQNNKLLLAKNPTLSKETLDLIYQKTIEYLGLQIELKQLHEIEAAKGSSYTLGDVLFRKREYNPGEYPEILAYAAATGKEPTSYQTRILKKLFSSLGEAIDHRKIRHLLLEFAGGGGKTSLLIPILCMFLIRKGKMPCISNTADLYHQSVELLPAILRDAYNLRVELLDRDVEHLWTRKELSDLKDKLKNWHVDQERTILMKASTWHSLHTASKMNCYHYRMKGDQDAYLHMVLIDEILEYVKMHGVLLEDECQENSDAHEVTVRSFEFKEQVPLSHHDIYLEAYKLGGDLEASVSFFKSYRFFVGLDWFEEYLRSPLNGPRHGRLLELEATNKALADLCILAKAAIHLHMPYTSAFTLGKEFGDSIHPGDKTAAPRHDGRPTSAHFSDAMLVSLLTIQKAFEEGVRELFLPEVVTGIRVEYESSLFKKEKVTFVETKLQELFTDSEFRMKNVSDSELAKLLSGHRSNSWLVERYLKLHALPSIQFHGSAAKSTAAEMALGFTMSVRMSAFVGIPEIYPIVVEQDKELLNTEFVAEVVAVLLNRNTKGILMNNRSNPKAFFEEMARKVPKEEFENLRAFFDQGIFANFSPEELIQAVCSVAEEKGLKRHGITWEDEKTIRVPSNLRSKAEGQVIAAFPLRQTTGRDYPDLDFTARCALFLHKNVTLSQVVQTVMRARKILLPNAQTLFWCAMSDLWSTISPNDQQFDVEKAMRWVVRNMANESRSKMVERAKQGIDAAIHAIAWKRVKTSDWYSPCNKSSLSYLCPAAPSRPWDLYDKPNDERNSGKELREYVNNALNQLELSFQDLPQESREQINALIRQTARMLDRLDSSEKGGLHQVGFHHHQHVQVHIEEKELGADTITPYERYGADDSLENEVKMSKGVQRFKVVGIHDAKLPEFYIPSIDRISPRKDWKEAMKLLSHMLVFKAKNGDWKFHVLTEAGARFYVEDIRKFLKVNYPELKAMVIAFGKTIFNATFNITTEECQMIRDSKQFRRIVSLLTMMQARAFDPHDFKRTIEEFEWTQQDYQAFCKHIRKSLPQGDDFAPEKYEQELFSIE